MRHSQHDSAPPTPPAEAGARDHEPGSMLTRWWRSVAGHEWDVGAAAVHTGGGKDNDISVYFTAPLAMEKFMWTAGLFCFDSFVECITYLPIRVLLAVLAGCRALLPWRLGHGLSARHIFHLLIGVVVCCCFWSLSLLDESKTYHLIRAQSSIKLWLLLGAVELADTMLCAIGRDVIDSLCTLLAAAAAAGEADGALLSRIALSFVCVTGYACLHATTMFVQVMTLTVAFNAIASTLVMVIFNSQLHDLRKTVFKRYDFDSLSLLAHADAVRRTHLLLMLAVLTLQNAPQHADLASLATDLLLPIVLYVGVEVLIDCVKYAFIVRLSTRLASSGQYHELSALLCDKEAQHQAARTPLARNASHELGFVPLPLAVLLVRASLSRLAAAGDLARMTVRGALWFGGAMLVKLLLQRAIAVQMARHPLTQRALRASGQTGRRGARDGLDASAASPVALARMES